MTKRQYSPTVVEIEEEVISKLEEEGHLPTEFEEDDLPTSNIGESYFG